MATTKNKTRKTITTNVKKAIKKHGPTVAAHVATGVAAGLATYLGTEGKKGRKNLKKIAKKLPGRKSVGRAVVAAVPTLKAASRKIPAFKGGDSRGTHRRSKKRASS